MVELTEASNQCDRWPDCACAYDTRKKPYDPCGRQQKARRAQSEDASRKKGE